MTFLIPFAVPLTRFAQALYHASPLARQGYEKSPDYCESEEVKNIAYWILKRDDISPLVQRKIQGDVLDWVNNRFRVIHHPTAFHVEVGVRGWGDRHYMLFQRNESIDRPLPWLVAHELCHLLHGDRVNGYFRSGVVTAIAALAAQVFFRPVAALATTLVAMGVFAIIDNYRVEYRADQFAKQVTTYSQREAARQWFAHLDSSMSWVTKILSIFTHPPLPYRHWHLRENPPPAPVVADDVSFSLADFTMSSPVVRPRPRRLDSREELR